MADHKKIFIACPIGDEDSEERKRSDKLLRHVIEPVIQDVEKDGTTVDLIRADKTSSTGRISKQMVEDIVSCDVMLADVTGDNPNVLYEVGLRQALLKPYILMAQRG